MAKRMLIDATHPEETRVVVLNGNRLEEFDFEASTKKQVKGNIYLAKVTRVEPSLQAAFVEYGGNRHGFLAFSEIHPDYYRIPVADRSAIGAESHLAELSPSEIPGEAADEGGVPLEQALPEPVAVIEGSPDEPADSEPSPAAAKPASADDVAETGSEAGDQARLPWEFPAVVPSWDEPSANAAPELVGTVRGTPAESEQSEEAASARGQDAPIPARSSMAALAGDQVVVAPYSAPGGVEAAAEPSVVETAAAAGRQGGDDRAEDAALWAREPETEGGETIDARTAADAAGYAMRPAETGADEDAEIPGWDGSDRAAAAHLARPELRDALAAPGFGGEDGVPETGLPSDAEGGAGEHGFSANGELEGVEARRPADGENGESEVIETLGGDEFEEVETRHSRMHRHYKIQEVIKRRQIMLVQVTKEERGNKGAALTTYLSLAGRYCVLMPNTARGGGVSRKITNLADRRRLKDMLEELDIPDGMGVIVRTAGAERSKAEIKRDYEYLLRLWNEIRELTLRSTAPALIYEEGDLIKRSIRDLYTRDIDEVLVEGEEGYRTAKAFMKMLMPSHAKRVQPYRDPQIGLLHRFQVESQIDAIHSPVVQLRSGGYVVIDQTEALVAIDVNSGRSTRERNIEETALRTNLEAAEEIARQLRLRDLAGLIVIDFIDMEEYRNQAAVERRLKDALKSDRARIQVGRISPFGLLEMSRQRLRSSLVEASTQPCPHCGGTGTIRSTESAALYVLRSIEEEGMRRRSAEVCVYVPTTVALYILNYKRDSLAQFEARYGIHVLVSRDDTLIPPAFRLERLRAIEAGEAVAAASTPLTQAPEIDEDEEDLDETVEAEDGEHAEREGEDERVRGRRRRRRRRRHDDERGRAPDAAAEEDEADEHAAPRIAASAIIEAGGEPDGDDENGRRRRRGRRGGRRRGRRDDNATSGAEIGRAAADTVEIVPVPRADDGGLAGDEAGMAAAGETFRPEAIQAETDQTVAVAATDIETASLPAFAGEGGAVAHSELAAEPAGVSSEAPVASTGHSAVIIETAGASPEVAAGAYAAAAVPPEASFAPRGAPAAQSIEVITTVGEPISSPSPQAEYGNRASAPQLAANAEPIAEVPVAEHPAEAPQALAEAAVAEPIAEVPVAEPSAEHPAEAPQALAEAAAAEPIAEVPVAEPFAEHPAEAPQALAEAAAAEAAQPAPDTKSEPEPEHQPVQLVQEVTKKPDNPRRGWWQRLIQS